jgi:hypothetical protein
VRAAAAKLSGASLLRADMTGGTFSRADLREADLRFSRLNNAILNGATLTGAKLGGVIGGDVGTDALVAEWVDGSPAGDGSAKLKAAEIVALLNGQAVVNRPPPRPAGAAHRYFGKGDVLKNAALQFEKGASVEIDSLFQNCSIILAEGTELVLGKDGVLADCTIAGAGKITIHGRFFERESPGIVGPEQLTVSRDGAVVASVQQHSASTRFAFEKGCRLRVKVIRAGTESTEKKGEQRA